MKVQNCETAIIPEAKITGYLLSDSHPAGRSKARFFTQLGFSVESWDELAQALRQHLVDNEIAKIESSPFGTRYVVEGKILTPDGRASWLRSIWFVATGEETPRFATAYPLKRRSS
ncbi:hypothetical protein HUU39_27245 [candidate division KSB1 bacterium]|nr:hypothetical protein [bacterium]NUM68921.1 hypothetical protein [candidate division KSB1 bacterium]